MLLCKHWLHEASAQRTQHAPLAPLVPMTGGSGKAAQVMPQVMQGAHTVVPYLHGSSQCPHAVAPQLGQAAEAGATLAEDSAIVRRVECQVQMLEMLVLPQR